MMAKFQSFLAAAVLAGVSVAGMANTARASIEVQVFEDGNATPFYDTGVLPGDTVFIPGGTFGNVTIGSGATIQASSNSPGGTDAMLMLNNFSLSTGGAHTFTIVASSDGFTNPVSPPNVFIAASATLNTLSGTATSKLTSSVGTQLLDTSIASAAPINLSGSGISGTGGTSTSGQFALNATYALTITNVITFGASGGTVTTTSGNDFVQSVPEPSTVVAALTGLPLLGFGLWRRRRANRAN